MNLRFSTIAAVALLGFAASASAQDAPAETPATQTSKPPYEARLVRLAEILGSVDYLRNLCNTKDEDRWREVMNELLATETIGEADRTQRLTAAFNHGYRSFAAVYTGCTPAAVAAEERYRREGATLAQEIVVRFGN